MKIIPWDQIKLKNWRLIYSEDDQFKKFEYLNINVLRACVFNKLYPPTPFSSRLSYIPDGPDYNGISSHFHPSISCKFVRKKILKHVNKGLLYYKNTGGITNEGVEYLHNKEGWWGNGYMRVQIIDGGLYAIPPNCCLPTSKKCCTPWIGPREKQTLSKR